MRSTYTLMDTKLLDCIYGVASPGSALEPMLETLSDALGAGSTLLAIENHTTAKHTTFWARTEPRHQALYVNHVISTHPLASVSARVPIGVPYLADNIGETPAISRAPALGDWCSMIGIRTIMGAHLVRSRDQLALLGFSNSRPFRQIEIARYKQLLPHIRRAFDLRSQLGLSETWRSCAETAFDLVRIPLLLTDGCSCIVRANRVAERWLIRAALGTDGSDRITHADHRTTQVLHRHIAAAVQEGTPAAMQLSLPTGDRTNVVIAPAVYPGPQPGMAMLLFATAGEADRADPGLLRMVFGLTQAEAKVALEIQIGQGVIAAASNLGIGVATARTHLHRTFEKTGTRRQSELVRLLDMLPDDVRRKQIKRR